MRLTSEQRIFRLQQRLLELELWIVRQAVPVGPWTFNHHPLAVGASWPVQTGVATIHCGEASIPHDWPLDQTRLELDLGGEGLIHLAYADGVSERFGLDPNHRRFWLRGRTFSIDAECVARHPFGVPNRDPRLAQARLIWIEFELADFWLLLTQLAETAIELNDHEVVDPLLSCAEDALRRLQWPSATATYVARVAPGRQMQRVWELPLDLPEAPAGLEDAARASITAAKDELCSALKALRARYPHSGALAMTGHAHLDLAWLWPLAETRRKARRTFHGVIGLMDRYPDFAFNQSSAQLYAFLEEDDPKLLAKIKDKVEAGQWETIGGMWVEPDTNMPTGEAFVRQLLYGQRYFERTFGRRHRVCWLPDCFGFSPALPQLLRLAGIDYFFTIKVNWSETNAMPFDLFWWEGQDGSRVLAHTFKNPVGGYNAETSPRAVLETWRNFKGKRYHGESLLAFGYGDGGGGPTAEMLERQRQLADFPVVPALRPVVVTDWFEKVRRQVEDIPDLPIWVGEMYLELHRGTLTTQSRTKYLHRRAERALITAEILAGMAALLGAPIAPSLEARWRVLLRNQFHDILPGSSIREVYQQAEAELASVIGAGEAVIGDNMGAIASSLTEGGDPALLVINPDLSPRPFRIETAGPILNGQPVEGGTVFAGSRTVPGLSAVIILGGLPPRGLIAEENRLENAWLKVELAADGTLIRVRDKQADREVLAGRGNQIFAYVDKPRSWDAWDIEEDYQRQGEEILAAEPLRIVESGPHRAAIRVVRRFRDSEIVQTVRLWANSPRLEFKTDIDWHERRILLKTRFPLAIRAGHATFECAHGVIRRPTHKNTSWDHARFEVAAHRFADLAEHGYGVALLNDGKYGHHALGNELGLSLLRSPIYPDPLADEGRQSFVYALYPHRGDWLSGGVLAEAEDLNQPLLCRQMRAKTEAVWTAAHIDGLQLGLSALKPGEDGRSLVLRTYEPAGGRGKVRVTLPKGWILDDELDLLEDQIGAADLGFTPFQVHTWRITAG